MILRFRGWRPTGHPALRSSSRSLASPEVPVAAVCGRLSSPRDHPAFASGNSPCARPFCLTTAALSPKESPEQKHSKAPAAAATAPSSTWITARSTSFHKWYSDVISAADLIDFSAVRGCMILKPRGYALWEAIKQRLDADIKRTGHSNAYFPMLLPLSFLSREAAHVEGFAQECAVVTHHRVRKARGAAPRHKDDELSGNAGPPVPAILEPDPSSSLQEPLVIRPTSETIIWDAYRRWINTHKDLPLLLNQWANVMRWEMRTRPFLRTSEFLWQEGHTAHATEAEAQAEAAKMASVYRDFLQDFLSIPVVMGRKSQAEKFAGAVDTMTCEAMMGNGWALQAATSHYLGNNFAKAFDVMYTDAKGERKWVWATSWGASTRMIGAVIMSHGDDLGLVLPPTIAPVQVGIVPIAPPAPKGDTSEAQQLELEQQVLSCARNIAQRLGLASPAAGNAHGQPQPLSLAEAMVAPQSTHAATSTGTTTGTVDGAGLRVSLDDDLRTPPGARYYALERSGCPLRLELGLRDVKAGVVMAKPRVLLDPAKVDLSFLPPGALASPGASTSGDGLIAGRIVLPNDSSLPSTVAKLLAAVHLQLRHNAVARMLGNVTLVRSYEDIERACDRVREDKGDEDGSIAPAAAPGPGAAPKSTKSKSGKSSPSSPPPPPSSLHPWLIGYLHDDPSVDAKLKERKLTVRCFPMLEADGSNSTWASVLQGLAASANGGQALPELGTCVVTGKEGCRLAIIGRAF